MTCSSFALVDGIPGEATGKNDGEIELYEFNYEIKMPTDLRDGSITGRRVHGRYTIVAELGKQSPLFLQHLCDNKEIATVTISHYQPDPASGDLVKYFSHELKKAKVVGVRQVKLNTCLPSSEPFRDMEEVSFQFEEIKIADEEGNEYTDKWELG